MASMPSHGTLFHLSGYPVARSRGCWGETWNCLSKLCAEREETQGSSPRWDSLGLSQRVLALLFPLCPQRPNQWGAGVRCSSASRAPVPSPKTSAPPSPCPLCLCMDAASPGCLAKSMSDDHLFHAKGIGGMETRKEFSSTQKARG